MTADGQPRTLALNCSTCGTTGITVRADHVDACPGPQPDHRPTEPDLTTGTRGDYTQWVIETKLGRRLAVCVDKSLYPEDARRQLERVRAEHPGLTFRAVRETTVRTEEDW